MIRAGYTSSVSLVVLGESLDPAAVSSVLKLDSHDSWSRGQPKRVGNELHAWGGWKRHLPPDRKSLSLEVQLEYWIGELLPRVSDLGALAQTSNRCLLDCFVIADAAWFRLSSQMNRNLMCLPLDLEFKFWSSSREA